MNPYDLIDILKGHKIYIQTHNFPDPDAMASAYGLQEFLKQHGVEASLCYDGLIDKLSTKRMITTFDMNIQQKELLTDMTESDYIVTVDSQKYNANLTDLIGDEVACIDHHPTVIDCEYLYKDVRMTGACASIIASYFYETNTPLNPVVAAALAYGIKMDTADFTRQTTPLDIDMFAFVYKQADVKRLNSMYTNVMEFDDLKAYAAAIENIKVYGTVGFSYMPFDCPDGLIATVSDFILALDVVDVSIIYSLRKDGIKFSVRSEIAEVDAGKLISRSLQGYGNGGGHHAMAGGFIPKENQDKLGKHLDYTIQNLFLDTLRTMHK
ncbi:MAG: DHH family phosphoesterase [Clostridiales bacterium]|nr:DHH family phosphoesterase [Clostridiales bacterium]